MGFLQALDLAFRQNAVGGDDGPALLFVLGGRLPVGIDAGQPVDQPLAVGAGHWASAQQPQAPQVAHRVADGTVGGVQPLGQRLLGRAALAGLKMHQQSVDRDGLGRVVGVAGDLPEHDPVGQVQAGAGVDGPTVDGGAAQGSRYGGWRLPGQECILGRCLAEGLVQASLAGAAGPVQRVVVVGIIRYSGSVCGGCWRLSLCYNRSAWGALSLSFLGRGSSLREGLNSARPTRIGGPFFISLQLDNLSGLGTPAAPAITSALVPCLPPPIEPALPLFRLSPDLPGKRRYQGVPFRRWTCLRRRENP